MSHLSIASHHTQNHRRRPKAQSVVSCELNAKSSMRSYLSRTYTASTYRPDEQWTNSLRYGRLI